MDREVTMKDVAEALGISTVSVSKALAGKKGVSEETRQRIEQKAEEMGYFRAGKKAFSGGTQGNIGVLVADRFFTECTFYASMYGFLLKKMAEQGYVGILEIVDDAAEQGCRVPYFIRGNKVSGIVVMGELSGDYVRMIGELGIPHILLDFYNDSQSDSVVSDGLYGGYALTRHLIELGHCRIGFVGSRLETSSIMDRFLGYFKALLQAGIPLREDWILEDRGVRGTLRDDFDFPDDMPTAFVCNCDEAANRVMDRLRQMGYRIPEDISVVGFDDFRFATLSSPQLTTFHVDIERMAEVAIARLVRKLRGKRHDQGRMTVSGSLVLRESTVEPPTR